MFSKVRLAALSGLFAVLSLVAFASAASASIFAHYQPNLPKSLRK